MPATAPDYTVTVTMQVGSGDPVSVTVTMAGGSVTVAPNAQIIPPNAGMTTADLYQFLQTKDTVTSAKRKKDLGYTYKHLSSIAETPWTEVKLPAMRECVALARPGDSQKTTISLLRHLDRIAFELDVAHKQYSSLLRSPKITHTEKIPFTESEIARLWAISDEPWVDTVLIFLYTGWRIGELLPLRCADVDLDEMTMTGGIKTDAGRNRVVPISPRIADFVRRRVEMGGEFLIEKKGKKYNQDVYRRSVWYTIMDRIGAKHTPHEARHTFATRMAQAGAGLLHTQRIMGHKPTTVTEATYTHLTLDDLRQAIALLG